MVLVFSNCMSGPNKLVIAFSISCELWFTYKLAMTVCSSSLMVDVKVNTSAGCWLMILDSFHLYTVFRSSPVFSNSGTINYFWICATVYLLMIYNFSSSASAKLQNIWNLMANRLCILVFSLYFCLCPYSYSMTLLMMSTEHCCKKSCWSIPEHSQQNRSLLASMLS